MCPGILFGAACTLTQLEEVLRSSIDDLLPYQTEVLHAILEQLRWFAGRQIRNVAVRESLMVTGWLTAGIISCFTGPALISVALI